MQHPVYVLLNLLKCVVIVKTKRYTVNTGPAPMPQITLFRGPVRQDGYAHSEARRTNLHFTVVSSMTRPCVIVVQYLQNL